MCWVPVGEDPQFHVASAPAQADLNFMLDGNTNPPFAFLTKVEASMATHFYFNSENDHPDLDPDGIELA